MFFKLTTNGWVELYAQLTKSELGLLYYIRSLDPFGDKEIEISTSEIARALQISTRTVQRALASLKEKGLIISKYIRTCLAGSKMSLLDDIVMEATRTDTQATQDDVDATQNVAEATPMSHKNSENQTQQAIRKPETNKTKKESKDSLSALEKLPEEERENFLTFAMSKADELPSPPSLPEAWINRYFDSLYSQFKKQSAPETQKATQDKQFTEWYGLMCQLGHLTGQRIENGVQLVQEVDGRWVEYEWEARFWKLDYLRKCVAKK